MAQTNGKARIMARTALPNDCHSNGSIQIARESDPQQDRGPKRRVLERRMTIARPMTMRFAEKIVGSVDKFLHVEIQ